MNDRILSGILTMAVLLLCLSPASCGNGGGGREDAAEETETAPDGIDVDVDVEPQPDAEADDPGPDEAQGEDAQPEDILPEDVPGEEGETIDPTAPTFGWGGYITDVDYVTTILDELRSGGWTAIRYWVRPEWLYGSSPKNWSDEIGDALVFGAQARGITVYLDAEHNYPPDPPCITSSNKEQWMADLTTLGLRYAGEPNVVLECVNEYTGDDQVDLYNECIDHLRTNGVHLPLLFNFWWNQPNASLVDPDGNYAIGRHFYPTATPSNATHETPTTLDHLVNEDYGGGTIQESMDRYFRSTTENNYLQEAIALGIPNGFVVTELGPGLNDTRLNDPYPFGMAYMMAFLREAAAAGVTVIAYRIGNVEGESKKALYEQRALDYFEEPLFIP